MAWKVYSNSIDGDLEETRLKRPDSSFQYYCYTIFSCTNGLGSDQCSGVVVCEAEATGTSTTGCESNVRRKKETCGRDVHNHVKGYFSVNMYNCFYHIEKVINSNVRRHRQLAYFSFSPKHWGFDDT